MPVVISNSRLVGHSTFETSPLTSCMNLNGVIFDIRSNPDLFATGEIIERKANCNHAAASGCIPYILVGRMPPVKSQNPRSARRKYCVESNRRPEIIDRKNCRAASCRFHN